VLLSITVRCQPCLEILPQPKLIGVFRLEHHFQHNLLKRPVRRKIDLGRFIIIFQIKKRVPIKPGNVSPLLSPPLFLLFIFKIARFFVPSIARVERVLKIKSFGLVKKVTVGSVGKIVIILLL
jgi:hypothetical protein